MKARIVEITYPDKTVRYQIQQRHWLFRWLWVGSSINTYDWVNDTYRTLTEAKKNLCWHDGTKINIKEINHE